MTIVYVFAKYNNNVIITLLLYDTINLLSYSYYNPEKQYKMVICILPIALYKTVKRCDDL